MRKALCVVMLSLLGLCNVAMAQNEHVALVKKVSGEVKVLRGGDQIVPKPGTRILSQDTIISGPQSSAGIVFVDGTVMAVGALAELEISNYVFRPQDAEYDFSVMLRKGAALYSSGRLAKVAPQSVKVNTPKATVGVRGTRFIIDND